MMDPYQTQQIVGSSSSTSSYLVQLDPTGHHYEIVDNPGTNILEAEHYFKTVAAGQDPTTGQLITEDVDIDPITIEELLQPQLRVGSQGQSQQEFTMATTTTTMEELEKIQIQNLETNSNSNGQISGTLMQIVSSFMTPGASAFQVDNSIVIYNPSGQIIQIPLTPTQQGVTATTVALGGETSSVWIDGQQLVAPLAGQVLVTPTIQGQQQVGINQQVEVIKPQQQPVVYTPQVQNVPVVPLMNGIRGRDEADSVSVSNPRKTQVVQAQQVPVIRRPPPPSSVPISIPIKKAEEIVSVKSRPVILPKLGPNLLRKNVEVRKKDKEEDALNNFQLKILSCRSLANEVKKENETKAKADEEKEEKPKEPDELERRAAMLKEIRELPPIPQLKRYRKPNVPTWLRSKVDKDDELLIAFKHRPDHTKTDICQFCYKWFQSSKKLRSHVRADHLKNPKLHECTTCGARFIARILRLRHEKLHKYDLKYRPIVYHRQPNLSTHFRRRFRPAPLSPWYASHLKRICDLVEKEPYPCIGCKLQFTEYEYLQDHYNLVHAIQICGFCGDKVDNFKSLVQHEQEKHEHYTITQNYEGGAWALWKDWGCEEVAQKGQILSNISYFHNYCQVPDGIKPSFEEDFVERVIELEEPEPELKEHVEELDYEYDLNTSLVSEISTEDMEVDPSTRSGLPFACTQCPKSYDNEHDLRRHVKCHLGVAKASLACQYCGRSFKTHSHKKEHERIHTGEKPYSCHICQRSFIQSSNLKKHMQTHSQISLQTEYRCPTCGKQFIKEASLILHQRAHAQDRKFRCTVCDRAYNYASLLKRHMRIHTGEMPYSCEACGMMFHELVSLHYHRKKVHTGERPHKCETCGRAFILSSDLKKHLQIHLKPQLERSPSSKPSSATNRKRSQSKSTDRMETYCPEVYATKSIVQAYMDSSYSVQMPTSIDNSDIGDDSNPIVLTPSPSSSLEGDVIQSNKPPVVRVYTRKDGKPNQDFPDNSTHMQTDGDNHPKIIYQEHVPSTSNVGGGGSSFSFQHISPEDAADAALLLAINRGDFTQATVVTTTAEDLSSINAYDFMNNVVPPDAAGQSK